MSSFRINNADRFFTEFTETLLLLKGDFSTPPIQAISLAHPVDDEGEYVYLTEQLSRPGEREKASALAHTHPLINYSWANSYYLKDIVSHQPYHLPILYQPKFIFPKQPEQQRQFDVGLIFSPTPERLAFLKELADEGISHQWINQHSPVFSIGAKTPEILKCKILLNLHAGPDYNVFEFSRCSIPVFNGQIVLSEECAHRELEQGTNLLVQSYVHFAPRTELIPTLKKMLADITAYQYTPRLELFETLAKDDIRRFVTEVTHRPPPNFPSLLERSFLTALTTPSDINQHVQIFREYARKCCHVTEIGVSSRVSSWGFLKGLGEGSSGPSTPRTLVNVDRSIDYHHLLKMTRAAATVGVAYLFIQGESVKVDIVETDLLFIDTWHVYGQLKRELEKYSSKVRKYILLHDTTIDGVDGESVRVGWDIAEQSRVTGYPEEEIRRGMIPAIEEFVGARPEWKVHHVFTHNNGLTILKRIRC